MHTCNSSTWETEAGGLLCVQGTQEDCLKTTCLHKYKMLLWIIMINNWGWEEPGRWAVALHIWSLSTLGQSPRGCWALPESQPRTGWFMTALLLQPEPGRSFLLLFVGDRIHIPNRGKVEGGEKALLGPILHMLRRSRPGEASWTTVTPYALGAGSIFVTYWAGDRPYSFYLCLLIMLRFWLQCSTQEEAFKCPLVLQTLSPRIWFSIKFCSDMTPWPSGMETPGVQHGHVTQIWPFSISFLKKPLSPI